MPARMKCEKCGTEWTYCGYPAYMTCPNCGSSCFQNKPVMKEQLCPHCNGTGKVITCEVVEPRYNGCQTDGDAERIAKEILVDEQSRRASRCHNTASKS